MLLLPAAEKSLWRDSYPQAPIYAPLSRDAQVDAVIVGGGIVGLTAAYLLKQSGRKVVVLERRTIGSGTTGRTTGKVTSQHNLIYADMIRRVGRSAAKAYAEANQAAVALVADIVHKENIDCDWHLEDNYIFTTKESTLPTFEDEVHAAESLGLPASLVGETPLPFTVRGAVKFTDQGTLNAEKYLLGLASVIHGDGSYVHEQSDVTAFHDDAQPRVETKHATVYAKHIIVATKIPSFPLAARFTYAFLEHPTESFSIACAGNAGLRGMYISPDPEHHSILPTTTNGRPVTLFVGAGGNIPGVRLGKEKHFRQLAAYASDYFGATDITHKWADMDYLPYDLYPLVGKVYASSKRLFQATGFMKWGLSNGTAAAIMLHDLVVGRHNPWTRYFDSTRLRPVRYIPEAVVRHFTDRR